MKRELAGLLVAIAAFGCGGKLRAVGASLSVDPPQLAFGTATVGTTQELLVQVSNNGVAALELTAVRVSADPQGELAIADALTASCSGKGRKGGTTLLPGECATFSVRWLPKAAHAVRGTIEIDSDDPVSPALAIPVTASSVAPGLEVCVLAADGTLDPAACTHGASAATLNFGAAAEGQRLARAVRLTNGGNADLHLSAPPRLLAGSASDFTLGSAPAVLAPGASADLAVAVTPSVGGVLQGTLEIASDDPLSSDVQVPLVATASAVAGAGWKLCVAPDAGLGFGSVVVGQQQTLPISFSNCGAVDFDLVGFSFTATLPTTAQFTAGAGEMPQVPRTLKVGDAFSIHLTYAPTVAQEDRASFDLQLTLPGGQQVRDSWPVTGSGAAVATGGCGSPPTARIAVSRNGVPINPLVARLAPLDTVTLDASSSVVPNGNPQQAWQLLSEPPGANDPLQGSGAQVTLQVRQAGDYQVGLTVTDGQGCSSSPVTVTLHVVPLGAVHVELTWKENYGDVDLHYLGPGGAFYERVPDQGDLYWDFSQATAIGARVTPTPQPSPDWGANGTVAADGLLQDDASLDVDQQWGNGPENVTHLHPFDGSYAVVIHYYCASPGENPANGQRGPATATVRVWVNGVLWRAPPPTQVLHAYQVWEAATVTVSNGGTAVTVNYSSTAPHDDRSGAQNCANAP